MRRGLLLTNTRYPLGVWIGFFSAVKELKESTRDGCGELGVGVSNPASIISQERWAFIRGDGTQVHTCI